MTRRRQPESKSQTLAEFSDDINSSALAILQSGDKTGTFGERKVFIAYLWAIMRMAANKRDDEDFYTLAEFKARLLSAMRAGSVKLARADLVGSMDYNMVRKSELEMPGSGSHVNFVVVDGAGSY